MPAELFMDCAGRDWSPVYKVPSESTVRSSLVGLLQGAPGPQPKGLELNHRPPKNPQLRSMRLLSEAWVSVTPGSFGLWGVADRTEPNRAAAKSDKDTELFRFL